MLAWLFFTGLGYAGLSRVPTYLVQRIPRKGPAFRRMGLPGGCPLPLSGRVLCRHP
jgi:hypothetical protein